MESARLLTVFCKLLPDSRWFSQNFHVMFILKPTRMAMAIFYSLKLSGNSVFIAILVSHICQLLPSRVRGKTRTAHGGAFILYRQAGYRMKWMQEAWLDCPATVVLRPQQSVYSTTIGTLNSVSLLGRGQ